MKRFIHLKENLKEGTLVSRYNVVAGLLGSTFHILLYFLYKYGFHLPYENIWLRLIAAITCLSLVFIHRIPDSFHPYLRAYYWHFTLIISLPFLFTAYLLMNNFHELWRYSEIVMVFILMMFVPNWLIFTIDFCIGVASGIVFYLLTPHVPLHPTFNIPLYGIVITFSIFAGYIYSLSNWKSLKELERQKAEDKYHVLEALAGSVAHEMRNPLSQVRHNLDEILLELPQNSTESDCISLPRKNIETINKRAIQAQMAINRGFHVINMTLENFRDTDIATDTLTCLSAATITRKAIEEYGYTSDEEKKMIAFEPETDFIFLGEEDNYTLVLYNLMVNALQVLGTNPNGHIDIRLKKGGTLNRIYVRDNGPGIPADILPRIFDSFFTSGKKGGTGLGLAFCKRLMRSFGGTISCNSEKDRYTEFVLEFPAVAPEVIKSYEAQFYEKFRPFFSGKKILIACDKSELRETLKVLLAPLMLEIDTATDGSEALKKLSTGLYNLVLTDINLPPSGAEEMANIIKNGGWDIPVVACSGSASPSTDTANNSNIDTLISMPPALPELLEALKSSLEIVRETLIESLSSKTVLVADDLDFNRRLIKLMLNKFGITIFEASNGLEAIELLKTQLFDLLIMDMRMPILDGFETAKCIRSIHSSYSNIPILGMSGNLDNATLKLARESGINDSIIKPLKLKPFLQKVTAMLNVSRPT